MTAPRSVLAALGICALATGLAWLVDPHQPAQLPLLALLAFAIQWLAFVPAYWRQSEHFYDLTGSLTYATLVLLALWHGPATPPALLLGLLVGIWCSRLGYFLFRRIRRDGKDGRFDTIKPHFGRFLLAWTLQGLWVVLTLLAALIAMLDPARTGLDGFALAGALIWATGFAVEVAADAQKSAFRADPANAGRFISSGLWAWSRHPNYFGEILLWCGIAVIALPSLAGWGWLGLLSPLFVALLITRVSGIPLLEAHADAAWGGQPDYERYKARTPVLIPRPPPA